MAWKFLTAIYISAFGFCPFTPWVLHLIILSASVWYSHSGADFYKAVGEVTCKVPVYLHLCFYKKSTFMMNYADMQQITYC